MLARSLQVINFLWSGLLFLSSPCVKSFFIACTSGGWTGQIDCIIAVCHRHSFLSFLFICTLLWFFYTASEQQNQNSLAIINGAVCAPSMQHWLWRSRCRQRVSLKMNCRSLSGSKISHFLLKPIQWSLRAELKAEVREPQFSPRLMFCNMGKNNTNTIMWHCQLAYFVSAGTVCRLN